MNTKNLSPSCRARTIALVAVALGSFLWSVGTIGLAQTAPADLPPAVADVVKLAQAHMSDEVILSYIKNNTATYSLTADHLIYLSGQGVSQPVIAALQSKAAVTASSVSAAPPVSSAPAPGPQAYAPAPQAYAPQPAPAMPQSYAPSSILPSAVPGANFESFRTELSPYGSWMEVPGYGLCWRPDAALQVNPGWRPYCDMGHWEYSDYGWMWQSDYKWGAIAFHYGRWVVDERVGWVWVPDYTWGPAWVCWRHAEGYCGWAPLPPGARFEAGIGLVFRGNRVAVDFDFGLHEGYFTFVGYDHFWDHDFHSYILPRDRVAVVFRGSRIMNDYRVVNGHFVNEGFGREHFERVTGRKIEVVHVEAGRRPVPSRGVSAHDDRRDARDVRRDDRHDYRY